MRPKTLVAGFLIALGIIAFVYQGISYTTRGRDVNIGPFHMTTEHEHHIPLPPIFGAIALIGGIAILLVDKQGAKRVASSLLLATSLLALSSCAVAKAVTIDSGRIDQLWLGFAVGLDGRVAAGCSASKFAPGDPIHLSMKVNEARAGSMVRVAVRDVDTNRVAWSEDRPVPAGQSAVTFAIGRKLVPGRYRAESSLDAGAMSPREFVVYNRLTR
jgi:hypothetical protein